MACSNCKPGNNGVPTGCGDKGHCSSGSCNKLNTFDWLTTLDIDDPNSYKYAEVSFKNGARKTFYKVGQNPRYSTGDLVIVDTGSGGYDIGRVSLMGDLVKIQMKKKNFTEDRITYEIIRKANQRDIDKMMEGRNIEKPALVKARVISRTLGLDMKIGDVEYQADLKKATFFYTSDGWVDFRELVKQYAKEFKVKIEMRQIGARQESARIGGIGACGRELCCSTWLTDFKSVNTTAARYQNIAINQSKLSGQCGRLKCCLNYELDLYIDELEKYPSNVEVLKAKNGRATLVKIDIFKEVLYYQYEPERGRSIVMPLNPDEVRRIKSMNERGEYPDDIVASESENQIDKVVEQGYSDVTGAVELPNEKRKKRKKKKPGQNARQESKVDSSNEGSVQDREPRKLTVTPKSKDPQITTEGSEKNLVVNKQNVQNREQSKQVQNPPKKANPNQNQGQNKNQVKNPNPNPNPNQNRNPNPNQGKENAKEPLKRELNPQKDNIVDKAIEDSEKQPLKRVLASEKIIPSPEQKPIDADKLESKNESNTSDTPSTNEPKSQHRMMRNNKKGKKDFYKSKNSSDDKDQKRIMSMKVVIIGAGPGGYVSAIRCAQLGMQVTIIEKYKSLGGTCLNVGCIPSKALLDSSEHYHQAIHQFASHGIEVGKTKFDFAKMISRKEDVIMQNTKGIEYLMKKNKIEVINGFASFISDHKIKVSGNTTVTEIDFDYCIIATGSKPNIPPSFNYNKDRIISSTEALSLTEFPKELIIVGAGVIGLELGSVYARLGAKVTVIEYLDRILPGMDLDCAKELQKTLKGIGIEFILGQSVQSVIQNKKRIQLVYKDKSNDSDHQLEADYCLVAIGRKAYTDGLELNQIDLQLDEKGRIPVNENCQTKVKNIFAIGDVIHGPMLAHKAEEEGVFVAEYLSGQKPKLNYNLIPGVVYTWPEMASVGMTEESLKEKNIKYKIGKFPFKALGRARASMDMDGFVKILADADSDEILGVHIVGARAADLIMEAAALMEFKSTAEDMSRICHPHPTFSEGLKEAALDATGKRAIHM